METQTQKKLPSAQDLQTVFAKVVGDWAKLEPQTLSTLLRTPAGAAIEKKVNFSGPAEFQLVIRTTKEFGLIIGRLFASGVDTSVDPEDAFAELVNMYCGRLKKAVWGNDVPYKALLPENSVYGEWPEGEPTTACFLRIGAFPVEIRLWEMASKA